MLDWYRFKPVDTLFFRGSEPMILGENHSATSIFPPTPNTIAGAMRTAVLIQNSIDFKKYKDKSFKDEKIISSIGRYSNKPPFDVIGPLFLYENEIFIPAPYSWYPYSWYMDSDYKKILDKELKAKVKPIKSFLLYSDLIKTNKERLFWAKPDKNELVSMGGYWIGFDDFVQGKDEFDLYNITYFVDFEQRTGIALNDNRTVKDGHVYSFNHARLKEGCEIVFGINKELPIDSEGILKLGAEQRFGMYKRLKINVELPNSNCNTYLSLSVSPKSDKANKSIIATGKILYFGGWDLAKGFHKPMIGYFPAGSVFDEKIDENLIGIK